jgi:hypothetical protein
MSAPTSAVPLGELAPLGERSHLEEENDVKPYVVHLRLALGPWAVHFRCPDYIKEETMQMLETSVVRKTIERTRTSGEVRYEILLWAAHMSSKLISACITEGNLAQTYKYGRRLENSLVLPSRPSRSDASLLRALKIPTTTFYPALL